MVAPKDPFQINEIPMPTADWARRHKYDGKSIALLRASKNLQACREDLKQAYDNVDAAAAQVANLVEMLKPQVEKDNGI